jgi:hypothetical protein
MYCVDRSQERDWVADEFRKSDVFQHHARAGDIDELLDTCACLTARSMNWLLTGHTSLPPSHDARWNPPGRMTGDLQSTGQIATSGSVGPDCFVVRFLENVTDKFSREEYPILHVTGDPGAEMSLYFLSSSSGDMTMHDFVVWKGKAWSAHLNFSKLRAIPMPAPVNPSSSSSSWHAQTVEWWRNVEPFLRLAYGEERAKRLVPFFLPLACDPDDVIAERLAVVTSTMETLKKQDDEDNWADYENDFITLAQKRSTRKCQNMHDHHQGTFTGVMPMEEEE